MIVEKLKWAGIAVASAAAGLALAVAVALAQPVASSHKMAPFGGLGAPSQPATAGGSRDRVAPDPLRIGMDPRSRKIIARLEEPVVMRFNDATPLAGVINHIRESTKSSDMPGGIPIYVDPIGLSEADKTMLSPIRNIDLEGIPLRRTLQLALSQLDLQYMVVDGMLYITSRESEGGPPAPMPEPSPLSEKRRKAERGELTLDEMKELIAIIKANQELEHIYDVHDGVQPPPDVAALRAQVEEAKQTKQLVESLSKLTQSLLEELKELRKAQSSGTASAAPKPAGNKN
jgi:hypothetical protein